MKKTIALFIGRFQPLHRGHVSIIKQLTKKYDLIKIAIGSSQHYHTAENPFTATERRTMINKTLKSEKIQNTKIYFVPDLNDNDRWISHLKKRVGKFDTIYSGNSLVQRLARERNIPTKKIKHLYRISATKIRNEVCKNKDVKKYLHPQTITALKKINGFRRIKKFCS